jgi:3-oxoacyl-[acyl-carrier-protein] synthase-1
MNKRCYLPTVGIINALGSGVEQVSQGLFSGDTSGMVLENGWLTTSPARVGRARGVLPEMPSKFADYACRNNRLLLAALGQIEGAVETVLTRYGRSRIGIVLGSSTTGMAEGEMAIATQRASGVLPSSYRYVQQEIGMPAVFLARYLGIGGPAYTICTACT